MPNKAKKQQPILLTRTFAEKGQKNHNHIGVMIDEDLRQFLTLYSFAVGASINATVRLILEDWKNINKQSIGDYEQELANRLLYQWIHRDNFNHSPVRDLTFKSFLHLVEEDLRNIRLDKEQIKRIIKILKKA